MPILPPEPFLFPDDLFADPGCRPTDTQRWLVLHTRPRAEKALARRFLARSLPFFLPLFAKRGRCRGRLFTSYLPLFPGYIFLLGDAETRLEALQTNLVAQCLPVGDQEQLHADLLRIHHLVTSGEPLVPEERLLPGTPVEIIDGPLKGLQGKIIRRGKRLTFVVEVNFLQRGASVEIDGWMIQPLSNRQPLACSR
ncbi:MAG TPA: transcription termination/antitermination NusG family protein [Gemmataceae bacterium]|nr:transcription termination/antitermination NusG family protein [Gemmataceae bacterium]